MITSVALNRITFFLPLFDLGKVRGFLRVKKPSRPLSAKERSQRFHFVTVDGKPPVRPDDLMGYVYVTPEGKAVYWYGREDGAAVKAAYLQSTPDELFHGQKDACATFDATRNRGDGISAEDRKHLLCDYYGDQKGLNLLTKTLG